MRHRAWLVVVIVLAVYWVACARAVDDARRAGFVPYYARGRADALALPWTFVLNLLVGPAEWDGLAWKTGVVAAGAVLNGLLFALAVRSPARWLVRRAASRPLDAPDYEDGPDGNASRRLTPP